MCKVNYTLQLSNAYQSLDAALAQRRDKRRSIRRCLKRIPRRIDGGVDRANKQLSEDGRFFESREPATRRSQRHLPVQERISRGALNCARWRRAFSGWVGAAFIRHRDDRNPRAGAMPLRTLHSER